MTSHLRLDDLDATVTIYRNPRAKRLTLTVPRTGAPPRLTAPPHVGADELRLFLRRQAAWLNEAVARAPKIEAVRPGLRIPVAGRSLLIETAPGPRRPPEISGESLILRGRGAPGPRIAAWLKERARGAVTPIAVEAAREMGAVVGRITMRDQKGRWGSCNSRGDLSFSWRLAMAPHAALDYVAVHEAAHILEMNYGPRFWAHVAKLRPEWKTERDWLHQHGSALHRYDFSAGEEDYQHGAP